MGKLEALNPKSTTPKGRRRRQIPEAVEPFIIKERDYSPQLSKDKLSVMITDLKKQQYICSQLPAVESHMLWTDT
ncbi:MAG: hypothetical protein COV02_00180 [Candidatus Terrybacteria bacterium CG10_big_fil_rev_8_21_14_0_10_41_10]|uniref:Uncharacterized protein n=1 Tax=Candidatus Terrybacteria bacterium CG10_big_fil_rev_8_21_14_0_10_41_10 TaxID=1975026 RepID=A0A2M8LBY1_9BACT|nr:MAG: hypothetical protein COV02_00180 [Candidatus Terrybacteria bacterium CG10_big_fil_rev_8_21_14_0_10_41_10]